jgi:hypothetical protein
MKRSTPEGLAAVRKARRVALKRSRARDPERARANQRRYSERLKADPERYAAHRESARIAYRLRRERRGLPVKPAGSLPKNVIKSSPGPRRLSSAPLIAFIDGRIEQRNAVVRLIGEERKSSALGDVCEELGIDPRALYRLRNESEQVSVGVAERVLVNAGVAWSDVYSYDDHPALYAEGGVLEGAA